MAKVDHRRLPPEARHHPYLLTGVFDTFKLTADGKEFLLDLLTSSEVVMLARRLEVARRLLLEWSFNRIRHDLHVGLDNIFCVDIRLNRRLPDYRAVPYRILKIDDEAKREHQIRSWLHASFPGHISLINTLLQETDRPQTAKSKIHAA